MDSAIPKTGKRNKTVTFSIPALDHTASARPTARSPAESSKAVHVDILDLEDTGLDGTSTTPSKHRPQSQSGFAAATSSSKGRNRSLGDTASPSPIPKKSSVRMKARSGLATSDSSLAQRRTRLPWLDGNYGRQGSVPIIPGAFVEDDHHLHTNGEGREHHTNQIQPLDSWRYELRTGADATMSPLSGKEARASSPSPSTDSGNAALMLGQTSIPARPLHHQLSHNTAQVIASRAVQAPVDDMLLSKPAMPLVTLARQLHISESTVTSDGDPQTRPRAQSFSESSSSTKQTVFALPPIAMPQPMRTVQPPVVTSPTFDHVTDAGPEYTDRSSTMTVTGLTPASPIVGSRRVSLTVQPLRAEKLRSSSEGFDHRRQRALSIQPVRANTWKELQTTLQDAAGGNNEAYIAAHRSPATQTTTAEAMNHAVEGLESLMHEAIHLARHAVEHESPEEVPRIFEEATQAMRKVSNVHANHEIAMNQEHQAHPSVPSSVATPEDEDDGPFSFPQLELRWGPKSSGHQSRIGSPRPGSIRSTRIEPKPAAETQAGVRTVWDEDWPHHRIAMEHPVPKLGGLGRRSVSSSENDPSTHDWAPSHDARSATSVAKKPVMVQKTVQFPLEPPAVQQPSREHVTIINRRPTMRQAPATDGPPIIPARKSSLAQSSGANVNDRGEGASPGHGGPPVHAGPSTQESPHNWGADKYDERDYESYDDALKGKNHITLKDGEPFHWGYKSQPIARNWGLPRKRWTAFVTCLNTALIGMLIGVYAGEVPAIQYVLADRHHRVILGNVVLYLTMGLVVLICWPLPLLHGRKPYTLTGLAVALPLQIPQAVIVDTRRGTNYSAYIAGLLFCRVLLGIALGFVHINLISTMLDLWGASLQSDMPHGEVVILDDVRRHGGGMGLWLGLWSWCFIGSLAIGFLIGAAVISSINISWGFYLCVITIAVMLLLNVITPETRRSRHRRTMQEVELPNDTIARRVARGEIKMHVSGDGPKWWWEEVSAGLYLSYRMLSQSGFLVMALYLAWIYAQVVLIIVLLGNLLSRYYRFHPEYVGLGVFGIAVGALLAIPSSKANIFSRSYRRGPRTDSMTFQTGFHWTSHFIRRTLFMTALPVAGLAYTLSSKGRSVQFMAPVIFAAFIGYISNLAISECNGLIMETFDTCDLQPGANSRHRLMSLAPNIKRKRTSYSSFPRVSAGLFVSQAMGFLLAAASTGIGGAVTRAVGAQKATAITAGILAALTILLTCALIRYRTVQVIPNEMFGHYFGSGAGRKGSAASDASWRAVVIGNPSGKTRRMNWLELGSLSRWTEIRRLNRLLNRSTTQALNPGWQ